MCEIKALTPNDELPSETDILERIYKFIDTKFSKFEHTEIDHTKWFNPSWTPFITYCFYKWGNELGFTSGLKRLPKFRDFYIRMEGEAAEEAVYRDDNLKEFLTIDVSWRPWDVINLEKSSSSPILYLALEHEEDTKPEKIVNSTYVGAQIDEVRKLGYVKSFMKILFVRPRYNLLSAHLIWLLIVFILAESRIFSINTLRYLQ